MKSIGIKLADGSFYPIMEEEKSQLKTIKLTTATDNQTTVHVDLYRSETDSMEDAEYVDTVEVSSLTPHPEGDPTLDLELSIDDENQLHARVIDEETGNSGERTVSLIKRTEIERSDPSTIIAANDTLDDENLLLSRDESADKVAEETKVIEPSPNSEEFAFDSVDDTPETTRKPQITEEESPVAETESYDLPDFDSDSSTTSDETVTEEPAVTETESFDLPDFSDSTSEEPLAEEPQVTETDSFDLPDFGSDSDTISEEPVTEETSVSETDSFDLPDFSDSTSEEPLAEEPAVTETESFDLPDFDDSTTEAPLTKEAPVSDTESFDLPDFDSSTTNDEAVTETDNFDLPDFGSDTVSEESVAEDESFDIPDFSSDTISVEPAAEEPTLAESDSFDLPDFSADEGITSNSDDIDFTMPDFDADEAIQNLENDSFSPKSSMFSDLYDEETREGNSANHDSEEDEEVTKKTRVPVIICIICAIICIIAVLLVLFVIPSKLNLFKKTGTAKKESKKQETAVVKEEKAPEVPVVIEEEPEVNELPPAVEEKTEEPVEKEDTSLAKEDEIVIATTPEAIVPEIPEPPKEKAPDISYKIKWGDTLWDIANAYYKNPWRYHKIAKYNNISDPDHIVSGTWILIPAE